MFYDTSAYRQSLEPARDDRTFANVVLTPSESKRLIARGVLALPETRHALECGLFLICRGITTAFIAEEVLGRTLRKATCTMGIVTDGRLASTLPEEGQGPWVFDSGSLVERTPGEVIDEFGPTDVAVKGANAVDPAGHVGILVGNDRGGTIGSIWPAMTARGSHLIVPVGLEKLVPSVLKAAAKCSQGTVSYVMGAAVSLIPVVSGLVLTEVEALEMLTGVTATHVASGGVGGSEGSVVLSLEGRDETVRQAFELVKGIKGEPPIPRPNLRPPRIRG